MEKMANEIDSDYNEKIKVSKDISAGAVLIASLFSVIVGFIVFYPYFYKLIANL
ncbi:MAG: diacylglycerol kinase family protein [Crocinitomicaceae bacterium]